MMSFIHIEIYWHLLLCHIRYTLCLFVLCISCCGGVVFCSLVSLRLSGQPRLFDVFSSCAPVCPGLVESWMWGHSKGDRPHSTPSCGSCLLGWAGCSVVWWHEVGPFSARGGATSRIAVRTSLDQIDFSLPCEMGQKEWLATIHIDFTVDLCSFPPTPYSTTQTLLEWLHARSLWWSTLISYSLLQLG